MVFRFGSFELDEELYQLRRGGKPLATEPKVFDLLTYLVKHRDHVATRDELLAAVWKGAHVSDSALSSCIRDVRRTLGDDGARQQSIQTVHGRGFRFVAATTEVASEVRPPARTTEPLPRSESTRMVFVGREGVMTRLRGALGAATAGRGACVLLSGEAGIGKTRTTEELASVARAHGVQVVGGRCSETAGAPAFWPWIQILRAYVGTHEEKAVLALMGPGAVDLAPLVPSLAQRFDEPRAIADPVQARFRLFDSLVQFLHAAATERPLVVVLDDLHQADTSTLLAFEFVARELRQSSIVLLGAYRDTDVARDDPLARIAADVSRLDWCERIELAGLSAEEVRAFLEQTSGAPPPASLVTTAHEKSAGNPFFLTEMIRLLGDGQEWSAASKPGWRLPLPRTTRDAIARRLASLPRSSEGTLAQASVLGREFDTIALERLSAALAPRTRTRSKQRLALHAALDAAETARIIEPLVDAAGHYRFTHVLIRDALYAELAAGKRRRLHRAAGEVLERLHRLDRETVAAALAHHFAEAADEETMRKAVLYSIQAGERDAAMLAYEGAVEHYRRAVELLERGVRLGARRSAGQPRLRLASRTRTKPARRNAEQERRGEALLALGENQWKVGDRPGARATLLRAAAAAREGRTWTQLARAALAYGGAFRGFDVGVVEPELIEMLEEALRHLGGEPAALRARVLARLAVALIHVPGSLDRRRTLTQQATRLAESSGDHAAHLAALYCRHWATWSPDSVEDRLRTATTMVRVSEREKDAEMALQAHRFRLIDQLEVGDIAGVDADLDACARLADELRQPYYAWYLTAFRAMRALLRSDLQAAQDLAQAALAFGQQAQSPNVLHQYGAQQFFIQRELGRMALVEPQVRAFVDQYPAVPAWRSALAFIQVELGRPDEARGLFEALAVDDFGSIERDAYWGVSMSLAADVGVVIGQPDQVESLYRLLAPFASHNALAGVGAVCVGSLSRNLGRLAAVRGRHDDAARHFEDALTIHERMQSRHLVAHTQRDYAEALLARGESDGAARLLDRALATYESLGMASFVERTRRLRTAPAGQPAALQAARS